MFMYKQPKVLICLLLILVITLTQRGRIPSHSKPHPPPQHSSHSRQSQSNCQIINGVNSCEQSSSAKAGNSSFNSFLIAGVLVVIGFVYMKKREIWVIKDIFKKEMTAFEEKILQTPCKLKEKDVNGRILAFQNSNFKIDDLRRDKIEHYKTEVRLVNLQKVKDNLYEAKFDCRDINGEGYFQGLVAVLTQHHFAVKFIKIYKKYTEMGERTKKIKSLMFYEGKGTLKQIAGQWHFLGYEETESHSGTWTMISV